MAMAMPIGTGEEPLGKPRVRVCAAQAEKLVAWAAAERNDPNDALSVAIAALRSRSQCPVRTDDYAAAGWLRSL